MRMQLVVVITGEYTGGFAHKWNTISVGLQRTPPDPKDGSILYQEFARFTYNAEVPEEGREIPAVRTMQVAMPDEILYAEELPK